MVVYNNTFTGQSLGKSAQRFKHPSTDMKCNLVLIEWTLGLPAQRLGFERIVILPLVTK